MASLTVVRAGPLTTVQDLGRGRLRHQGVSLGGALDHHAARIANLLVGNDEAAALLEVTLGRARIRFRDDRLIAWCGGEFELKADEMKVPAGHSCFIRSGEELTTTSSGRGCRAWIAISGGIDVPSILGSRSTDLRGTFGGWQGRPLRDGDELPLGQGQAIPKSSERVSCWSAPVEWTRTATAYPILRVVRGSEWEEFSSASRSRFLNETYIVSPNFDRMGVRLSGVKLERGQPTERLSEPVAPGTIQVPNDGQPILLLGDCQTIGGYPRIAHVITVDLPQAAQLRPDDSVRFQELTLAEATILHRNRERDMALFHVGLRLRAR
jgi:antagonist of KipI